ncbi:MAG: hypothetical protein VW933_06320 [Flavobacteriaceae bacterium]
MLRHFFLLLLWGTSLGYAQTDRADPYSAITAFFEAFHQANGPALADAWHPEARLYSTQLLPDGSTRLRAAVVADFVKAVAQRPAAPTSIFRWLRFGCLTGFTARVNLATGEPTTFYSSGKTTVGRFFT